jgi:hypothetical protein
MIVLIVLIVRGRTPCKAKRGIDGRWRLGLRRLPRLRQ